MKKKINSEAIIIKKELIRRECILLILDTTKYIFVWYLLAFICAGIASVACYYIGWMLFQAELYSSIIEGFKTDLISSLGYTIGFIFVGPIMLCLIFIPLGMPFMYINERRNKIKSLIYRFFEKGCLRYETDDIFINFAYDLYNHQKELAFLELLYSNLKITFLHSAFKKIHHAFYFSNDSDYKSRHTKKSQYKIEAKVRKIMLEQGIEFHTHDFDSTLNKKSFLEKEDE